MSNKSLDQGYTSTGSTLFHIVMGILWVLSIIVVLFSKGLFDPPTQEDTQPQQRELHK